MGPAAAHIKEARGALAVSRPFFLSPFFRLLFLASRRSALPFT